MKVNIEILEVESKLH
jgi:hypothetical protein